MDILTHNPITEIPTGTFCWLLVIATLIACITCSVIGAIIDKTESDSNDLPVLITNPYEIAYLTGQTDTVTRLAIYKLWKLGALVIDPLPGARIRSQFARSSFERLIRINPDFDLQQLDSHDRRIVEHFEFAKYSIQVLQDVKLKGIIKTQLANFHAKSVDNGLLTPESSKKSVGKVMTRFLSVLLLIDLYRILTLTFGTGGDDAYSLLFLLFFIIGTFAVCGAMRFTTRRGRQYIRKLKAEYPSTIVRPDTDIDSIKISSLQWDMWLRTVAVDNLHRLIGTSDESFNEIFSDPNANS